MHQYKNICSAYKKEKSSMKLKTNFLYSSSNTAILNIHWGMNPKQIEIKG